MNVTINQEQQRYVIGCGSGYSCLGFDVVLRELRLIAARITGFGWIAQAMATMERGSMEAYDLYQKALAEMAAQGVKSPTWFAEGTPLKVQRVLEQCRTKGNTVRVWFGDPRTGRDGLNEFEVYGRIGRSGGTIRAPLLCTDDYGGGTMFTDRILRIVDVQSRKELYRHPKWHLPEIELRPNPDPKTRAEGYAVEALVEGHTHARFRDDADAAYWLAMMAGRSLENPGPETEEEVDDLAA